MAKKFSSHPLALVTVVTLLQTVLAVEAGLGEEVLGEVVLQTSADVGHGHLLTALAVAVDVGDVLVSQTSRHVRTQTYARGTEVVDGVQGRRQPVPEPERLSNHRS